MVHEVEDGVIHLPVDLPIVHQEGIGHAAQSLHGLGIVTDQRLIGDIAAGRHQHGRSLLKEQML